LAHGNLNNFNEDVHNEMAGLRETIQQVKELLGNNNSLASRSSDSTTADHDDVSPSLTAASKGLFDPKDLPRRSIPEFGTVDKRVNAQGKVRKDIFVWQNYRDLIDRVRSPLPKIDDETWYACKGNCTPRLVRSIIARVKNDPSFAYDFDNEKIFKDSNVTMQMEAIWKLEDIMAPHLPLRACIGNWGAKHILSNFWLEKKKKKPMAKGKLNLFNLIQL
jgi:hypothetical protein